MVDFPTPPLPEEMARIFPRFGWSMGCGAGGTCGPAPGSGGRPVRGCGGPGWIGDVDLDFLLPDALDCGDGRAGRPHQRSRVFRSRAGR